MTERAQAAGVSIEVERKFNLILGLRRSERAKLFDQMWGWLSARENLSNAVRGAFAPLADLVRAEITFTVVERTRPYVYFDTEYGQLYFSGYQFGARRRDADVVLSFKSEHMRGRGARIQQKIGFTLGIERWEQVMTSNAEELLQAAIDLGGPQVRSSLSGMDRMMQDGGLIFQRSKLNPAATLQVRRREIQFSAKGKELAYIALDSVESPIVDFNGPNTHPFLLHQIEIKTKHEPLTEMKITAEFEPIFARAVEEYVTACFHRSDWFRKMLPMDSNTRDTSTQATPFARILIREARSKYQIVREHLMQS